MLKTSEIVKDFEDRAEDAIHVLLRDVPGVQVESVECDRQIADAYKVDGLIMLLSPGGSYALVVEAKRNGAPSVVRSAIYQLLNHVSRLRQSYETKGTRNFIPMLVCPYLSPASRAICKEHDVAYLDLFGNARLAFDNVYIERAVAEKPRSEARALRSVFSPKAAAILRVMLRQPDRPWRVADLAAQAHASYGHVSNVRKALLEREWLEIRDDGAVLTQPDTLLKTWRENYRPPAGESIWAYTHFHGRQLHERVLGKLNCYAERPRAIYSRHSAAQWLAPFSRGFAQSFYVDDSGAELLERELQLTRVERGASVGLHIPTDESLFHDAIERGSGVFCTNPLVTYLDLWIDGDRDREAAEHLAIEFFPWLN